MGDHVASGDVVLHVRELARGIEPALLALHGYGDTLAVWTEVARLLDPVRRLIAYDLRGHGDSGWPADGDYSLAATVRDTAAVAAHFGVARPVVAGHSTGGMTALAYGAARPDEVSALILLDVDPLRFKDGLELLLPFRGADRAPSFDALVDRQRASGDRRPREAVAAWLRPRIRQRPDGSYTWKQDPRLRPRRALRPLRPRSPNDVEEMLGRIRAPVLWLRGEQSRACTASGLAAALAHLGSRHTHAVEVPATGHALLAERPAAVARAIEAFLGNPLAD